MAAHFTQAQIQVVLAKTVSAIKPYELFGLVDALSRTPYTLEPDADVGAHESTLATIFPSSGLNP